MSIKKIIKNKMDVKNIIKTKILVIIILLSIGTVKNLNAQCPHTPKCIFDSCHYGGDGLSEATAFQIWSKEHLQELADIIPQTISGFGNFTTGKHFRLMTDITDSVDFLIGNHETTNGFQGYFYGGGNKITLAINFSNLSGSGLRVALFSLLNNGGIDSLIVDGYVITNNISSASGIVGIIFDGFITNCTNNSTVQNTGIASGIIGVVGTGSTKVNQCINNTNNGMIIGQCVAGIIMGASAHIDVVNCLNNGHLIATGTDCFAGGIIGGAQNANMKITVSNNLNIGTIEGYHNTVGGILGRIWLGANVTITNNINYGFTKSTKNVGGVIGDIITLSPIPIVVIISNNSNFGVVIGEENTGCIVGSKGTVAGTGANITIINNHYDKQMCGEEE